MFTGIIEEVGYINDIVDTENGKRFSIAAKKILLDTDEGDSISVNGVCLTAFDIKHNLFKVDLVEETLGKTNLGELLIGSSINLERSLTLSTRIGGHILQGHVECVGTLIDKTIKGDSQLLKISIAADKMKYCIPKGSIAIDGISLTIAEINKNIISIAIIPHTIKNTNLESKEIGDSFNIETDILGKYIERLISSHANLDSLDELLFDKMKYWELGET